MDGIVQTSSYQQHSSLSISSSQECISPDDAGNNPASHSVLETDTVPSDYESVSVNSEESFEDYTSGEFTEANEKPIERIVVACDDDSFMKRVADVISTSVQNSFGDLEKTLVTISGVMEVLIKQTEVRLSALEQENKELKKELSETKAQEMRDEMKEMVTRLEILEKENKEVKREHVMDSTKLISTFAMSKDDLKEVLNETNAENRRITTIVDRLDRSSGWDCPQLEDLNSEQRQICERSKKEWNEEWAKQRLLYYCAC
ncbi:hypothetical protein D9758_013486 [Tetrapyrgos nigripes]|uniref:Uncharacterized protein n=1 Tax=Tetrapyrgos nigripes TaxID=182062 RepID=A0A8H5FR70_9AGAR|nr:hypothetical protein D9758_013486 [Tetrapyrgos nigripes]